MPDLGRFAWQDQLVNPASALIAGSVIVRA
jgi:hypothetical protein